MDAKVNTSDGDENTPYSVSSETHVKEKMNTEFSIKEAQETEHICIKETPATSVKCEHAFSNLNDMVNRMKITKCHIEETQKIEHICIKETPESPSSTDSDAEVCSDLLGQCPECENDDTCMFLWTCLHMQESSDIEVKETYSYPRTLILT